MSAKKYGLILPDKVKNQPVFEASSNVFGNEDDSEDEVEKKQFLNSNTRRQDKIVQAKAVIDDPTVYQYDEIYDDLKEKRNEEKKKAKVDKNPKYIENLLKTAQKRKLENERRIERQVQKEREKEGEEFADKEIFVTSAYKKKLEEMRKEDEKEKYEEYLETIGDVTKQKDLGGFYRHLYEQKLGPNKISDNKTDTENSNDNNEIKNENEPENSAGIKTMRNYRKRKVDPTDFDKDIICNEDSDSEDEINRHNFNIIKAAKNHRADVNLDADSDFSINDPSDSENDMETKDDNKTDEKPLIMKSEINSKENDINENKDKVISKVKIEASNNIEKPIIKPKIDIWKKRTVGPIFEEALKRYYERKAGKCV